MVRPQRRKEGTDMSLISLEQAAKWCGGSVAPQYKNVTFCGANNDSRSLTAGQLFVALKDVRDGHDFIPAALERGAAAVLCTHADGDFPAICVPDTHKALGDIARGYRQSLPVKVVGITGSVGKSTTKEMTAAILSRKYQVSKTPANHNNDIGMPMAILDMDANTEVAVLEMGMNHYGEMSYLTSIAQPDVAVIVNIGTMHIEHLGSREGILNAKLEILEGLRPDGAVIFNGDEPLLRGAGKSLSTAVTYFGAEHEENDLSAVDYGQIPGGCGFMVRTGEKAFAVELPMEGRHLMMDALAAIAVGLRLEIPLTDIVKALAEFQPMQGRQEIFKAKDCTIIKDCYNAGPESMAASLSVLGGYPARRIAVLGDMLELGICAQAEHYRVGRIAAMNSDLIFALGQNARRVVSGAITGGMRPDKVVACESMEELGELLRLRAKPGDTLLFKGSRGMRMERALELFLQEK